MSEISKIKVQDVVYDIKDEIARNYTAWEVYPTLTDKNPGEYSQNVFIDGKDTTYTNRHAIAASATELIHIFTSSPADQSDVVIDWGDGTVSSIANGEFYNYGLEDNTEHRFEFSHTYTEEKVYTIKVYGKNYWKISHPRNGGAKGTNLMCRVLTDNLPIAPHLNNLASFCAYSSRLLYVDIPPYHNVVHAANLSAMFLHCNNLKRATGFKRMYNMYCMLQLFMGCDSLEKTDFRFSPDVYKAYQAFYGCHLLVADINKFFQTEWEVPIAFKCNFVDFHDVFRDCYNLTGTFSEKLKGILWNSKTTSFHFESAFKDAAVSIRKQVPQSWGGTASDSIITDHEQVIVDSVLGKLPEVEDGKDGVTFTPSVDANGNLSWTNNGGLNNPASVNIKGDKGEDGKDGVDGTNGTNGTNGTDGKNGVTFTPSVDANGNLSWTNDGGLSNPSSVNIKGDKGEDGKDGVDGTNGTNGTNGTDGKDGVTFTPSVDSNGNLSWTNDGGLSNPVSVNIKGEKPISGVDYFTEQEKQNFVNEVLNLIPTLDLDGEY